jgi:hypothetical protein
MSIPSFLRFEPVPVRKRHDGWTPARQLRFVLEIARGAGPAEAARLVGMTRQTAYGLRRKPGGSDFARAWDEAEAFALKAACAGRKAGAAPAGIDTIWTPRTYRGRLVGFVAREELAAPMRVLARLDRMAERLDPAEIGELREVSERMWTAETAKADNIGPAKASASSVSEGFPAHPIFTHRR